MQLVFIVICVTMISRKFRSIAQWLGFTMQRKLYLARTFHYQRRRN